LKYSQLIQILRINPPTPAIAGFATVIAASVNQRLSARNGTKPAIGYAKTAFAALKTGPSG
jgi:hypothetical protein